MASKLAFPYFRRSSTIAGTEQRGVLIPNQLLPKISWLNLGSSGISVIERLCLEEVLLRHDPLDRNWVIVGSHHPTRNKYLKSSCYHCDGHHTKDKLNEKCIIVMGIGGKPATLVNTDLVRKDGTPIVKRFSGGGTVVLDQSSLWTTVIGRTEKLPHIAPYPRDIMKWTGQDIFGPTFASMKEEILSTLKSSDPDCDASSQQSLTANDSDTMDFILTENDYALGERKMGGNAQAIVKGGWLHHTSFLWDYEDQNMEYLVLPGKRPKYRGDRPHRDFLVKLKSRFGALDERSDDGSDGDAFFRHLKRSTSVQFHLEESSLKEVMDIIENKFGGIQEWFDGKCRTRIIPL